MTTSGTSTSRALVRHARRGRCALLALLALMHHADAQAQASAVVLVAVDGRPRKLEEQLHAELRAASLIPQPVAWSDVSIRPDGLLTLRDASQASALLHVSRHPLAIEVWLADRDAGGLTRRESVPRASDGADTRLVATRVSELVRAALLPVREVQAVAEPRVDADRRATAATPQPAAAPLEPAALVNAEPSDVDGPVAVGAPQVRAASSPIPKFGLGLGAALSWDPDRFGPGVRLDLGASFRVRQRWTLATVAMVPTIAQVVRETNGRVAMRAGLLDLEIHRELADSNARLRPRIGLGAGLAWAHLRKRTNSPDAVHRSIQLEACLLALVGGSLRVWSRVSLALDLRAGAALPRAVARIDGQRVASAGIPLFIGSLRLELPFG